MCLSDLSILPEFSYQEKESGRLYRHVCLPQTWWEQRHLTASLSCVLLNFKEMHSLDQDTFLNGQIVICQNLVRSSEILLTE